MFSYWSPANATTWSRLT